MKKILVSVLATLLASTLLAQTPEEIVAKMDLVVSKATYLPISTTVKEKGVTVTMRDYAIGVTEEQVTFDPAKYADAKIIDKR